MAAPTNVSGQGALSDIFGDRATLLAQNSDSYLGGLGILLTTVYVAGINVRPKRQVLGFGVDSLAVLCLYIVGVAGLFAIAALSGPQTV